MQGPGLRPASGGLNTGRWLAPRRWAACLALCLAWAVAPPVAWAGDSPIFEGQQGWLFPDWESLTHTDAAALKTNVALLASAQQLFRQAGIELVIVVVPTKAVFDEAQLPNGRVVAPMVRQRYQALQQLLAQAGLVSVNLWPPLKAAQSPERPIFYRTDYHWTSVAAEAAADAVAQRIRQQPWAPPDSGQGTVLGEWVNERHYGDLSARYLPPDRRRVLGRDWFTVRLPVADNTSLLDDGPAPVHVMGNSFVQPYWGFAQRLSQQLGVTTSLTWNAGTVGQWVIAVLHAESQLQGQPKPKVLVWQMNEAQVEIGPNTGGLWDIKGLMEPQAWLQRLQSALAP